MLHASAISYCAQPSEKLAYDSRMHPAARSEAGPCKALEMLRRAESTQLREANAKLSEQAEGLRKANAELRAAAVAFA